MKIITLENPILFRQDRVPMTYVHLLKFHYTLKKRLPRSMSLHISGDDNYLNLMATAALIYKKKKTKHADKVTK